MYKVKLEEDFINDLSDLIVKYEQYPRYLKKFENEIFKFLNMIEENPKFYISVSNTYIRKAILVNIKCNIYFYIDDKEKEIYVYKIMIFSQNQDEMYYKI